MKHYPLLVLILSNPFTSIVVCAQQVPTAPADIATPRVSATAQLTLDDLRTFTDVFNQVRKNYVEPVDDNTLLNAAINGMLAELDPHSAFLPSSDYEDLENSAKGQYVGLGIDVVAEKGRMVIKHVISPSPADTAGINPGDIITSVDNKPVKGRPVQEAIDELYGPPDSTVELVILKPDDSSSTLVLKREFVKVPALSFRLLEKQYGYFRIVYFHRDSATDLKQALDSVLAEGTQLHGLILDLRNNPGGVLQPAIEIADGFLDQGKIVSMRGRHASMDMEYSANPGQWLPGIPLVLLVDSGSASASEVLAGALQDNRRAVVVGQRTFGKGSVQSVLPLRNGSGIKLTTARYYTPTGKSIQVDGIVPDVVVAGAVEWVDSSDNRKREIDLEGHLNNEAEKTGEAKLETVRMEEDYPLHEALQVLRVGHIFSGSMDREMK
ncbi:MAG TPA: S41 family peptidase [Xanthomonadales bacterium]|nr:S41 family peptidase [Xanthomonadales bacterium]